MRHVIHLLKKDLWAMRWALALMYAVLVMQTAIAFRDPLLHKFIASSTSFVPLVNMLAVLGVAGLTIQQESLVGTTAFWMTRPIPKRSLLASKLLFLILFVVIPSVLCTLVVVSFYHLAPEQIPPLLWKGTLSLMAMLLGAVLLASVTSGIAAYAAAWIVYVVGNELLDGVMKLILRQDFSLGSDAALIPAQFALVAIIGGGLIFHQYVTRRTRRTILAIAVSLIGVAIAGRTSWLTQGGVPVPSSFTDQVTVGLSASGPEDSFIVSRDLDSATKITVNTDVLKAPPARDIRISSLRGDLQLNSDRRVPFSTGSIHLPAGALGTVFPNFHWVGIRNRPSASLRVAREHSSAFEEFIGKPAQLHGIAEGETFAYRVAGRIPLVVGARFDHEDYGAVVEQAACDIPVLRSSCVFVISCRSRTTGYPVFSW